MTEDRARFSGAWYLALLLTAPVLYAVVDVIAGAGSVLGPLPTPLVPFFLASILGIVAWIRYRPDTHWDGWTRGWLMLGVVLWLYATVLWNMQGEPIPGGAVLLPVTFLLVLLKRPRPADAWIAADVFAWSVVAGALVALVLEVVGIVPTWYAAHGEVGRELLAYDLDNYWLPLREVLGLEGRWGGYETYPNIQGQAGALLLVYGFARRGVTRVAFASTGVLILLLTDSRTSYAAAAIGLVLLALLPGLRSANRRWPTPRILALVLGVAMAVRVALKFIADPNLTGRLSMWPEFLSLTSKDPVLGAGSTAINDAVDEGSLPGWADQGHNILIDTLVRFGVVGLLLAVAFLGLAIVIGIRGARLGDGLPVALAVALLMSCMGDLGLVWSYPTAGMSVLIISVLLARRPANPV